MEAFYNVVTAQADAYANLKTTLGMNNTQLIRYLKTQLINGYNQTSIILGTSGRK